MRSDMDIYVVTRHVDRYHGGTDSDVCGVFTTLDDAIDAIKGLAIPCYRAIPGGMWKLVSDKAVEKGLAHPRTKDGEVWEIYGPNGMLVDGNGMDEPEYRIGKYEIGKMEVMV